jgi:short-subunit dehydrogenase
MHIVITGASSGIGEALAREFASHKASVTLVARRKNHLEKLANSLSVKTHVVACDLSDRDNCTEWIAEAEKQLGPIDVLINNAGVQIIGASSSVDPKLGERLLDLNLATPLRLTRAVLPGMIARGKGTVVNVASLAALAPTPGMSYYNASKAGLAGASEALRGELSNTGVKVLTVYPGIIETAMGKNGIQAYQSSLALRLQPRGTTEELAKRVYRAVQRKQSRVIYPGIYRFLRVFPAVARWSLDRFTPALAQDETKQLAAHAGT